MDHKIRMKAEVERWRQSGLTQKEYSQQLGIKVATFAYWLSRNKEENKTGFVSLRPGQRDLAGEIEITYPNGVRFNVSLSDPGILSRLIHLY
ncbi:IS66 family insertion sequence element accessory protein TnpA [Arcticibacter sp.]|uniref:IS66 family insertion sequence element accessory protein TnpA n=1 Tax=Arcticibacter sp. TaxID=1872630 RepID=UPI00388E0BC2